MVKLVCGVGLNDSAEPISPVVDGVQKMCPIYSMWKSMLNRCYKSTGERSPTYQDCFVCDDWLRFSTFRSWVKCQQWEGFALDKDLLLDGNKQYHPDRCIFVSQEVNSFMTDRARFRGEWPEGVSFYKRYSCFVARCNNHNKSRFIGYFDTTESASHAYRQRKSELARELAARQDDPRVASALIAMYSN